MTASSLTGILNVLRLLRPSGRFSGCLDWRLSSNGFELIGRATDGTPLFAVAGTFDPSKLSQYKPSVAATANGKPSTSCEPLPSKPKETDSGVDAGTSSTKGNSNE